MVNLMKSQLFLLKVGSIIHSYFILGSLFFVILTSIGSHNIYTDIAAFITFCSFFIFERCVLVDVYDHIKQDLSEKELPGLAKDKTRRYIKSITNKIFRKKSNLTEEKSDEIERIRLDILKNVHPFIGETDEDVISDMFNRKIQYTCSNIILGTILANKYNIPWMNMILMIWMVITFPF